MDGTKVAIMSKLHNYNLLWFKNKTLDLINLRDFKTKDDL